MCIKYKKGDYVEFKYIKEGIVGKIIRGNKSTKTGAVTVHVLWEGCNEPTTEYIECLERINDWKEIGVRIVDQPRSIYGGFKKDVEDAEFYNHENIEERLWLRTSFVHNTGGENAYELQL